MLNLVCHSDWATKCPEIWLNIVVGVSARVFVDGRNSKADCPPQYGCASSSLLKACPKRKKEIL